MLSFTLTAPASVVVTVTNAQWDSGCGQTGGPWIAYGSAGSNDLTALADNVTTIPTLAAGKYDLFLNFESVNPCALKSATLTLTTK